jgi:hypothetical protein
MADAFEVVVVVTSFNINGMFRNWKSKLLIFPEKKKLNTKIIFKKKFLNSIILSISNKYVSKTIKTESKGIS